MEGINAWNSLIYKDAYSGDLSKMLDIANAVSKQSGIKHPLEEGGLSTWDSTVRILELPEFTDLTNWLIEKHSIVWQSWGFKDFPRFMHKSWINWHPPGASTLEHDHGAVALVMSIYLNQPINGGNIQFKDPLEYQWSASPRQDDNNWITVPVQTGDVLFFPGFIKHRTEKNNSTEDRFVLTVNMMAKYV